MSERIFAIDYLTLLAWYESADPQALCKKCGAWMMDGVISSSLFGFQVCCWNCKHTQHRNRP